MTSVVTVANINVSWEGGEDGAGSVALDWRIQSVVRAPIQSWELPSDTVSQIVAQFRGQEITINHNGKLIKRVIVLGNGASKNPQTQLLLLTDVRWYWTRGWLCKAANVRERIGDTHLVGDGDVQAQGVVDSIRYAPWSLNGSTAYTWQQLLSEEMGEATKAAYGRPLIAWVIDEGATLNVDSEFVQEELVDDTMPAGIAAAVGALPGRDVYVDLEGVVHVYDACPGAEDGMLSGLPPALDPGWGSLRKLDNSALRSPTYRVLFDPELEVLLFALPSTFTTDNPNLPWMENVVRIPDKSLSIPSVSGYPARVVGEGSYATIEEACAAWGAPTNGQPGVQLTVDLIRTHYNNHAWFLDQYIYDGSGTIDDLWASRIDAILRDFRSLWRANYRFWSRVRSVLADRCGVWDTATGGRVESPIFSDYARCPHWRAALANRTKVSFNVTSWNATVGDCQKATPGHLEVVNDDQGIFRTVWSSDVQGLYGLLAPSALVSDADLDVGDSDTYQGMWQQTPLTDAATFQLATIVSCVPAAPNDLRRLYPVDVSIDDAISTLNPSRLDPSNRLALSVTQFLRARAPLTSARFSYPGTSTHADDEAAIPNLAVFGAVSGPNVDPNAGLEGTTLVPQNQQLELVPMARVLAASVLINQFDHWEGTREVAQDFSLRPWGSVISVTHRVTAERATTVIEAVTREVHLDPIAFLPASARKVIAREVQG